MAMTDLCYPLRGFRLRDGGCQNQFFGAQILFFLRFPENLANGFLILMFIWPVSFAAVRPFIVSGSMNRLKVKLLFKLYNTIS